MPETTITPIAHIHTDFPAKFGLPRQSGLVAELQGRIVFEAPYRQREAFRGLENFTHLWLVWQFSAVSDQEWRPTVRPPRLGGNRRVGVFATRSPYRPNHLALSCVKLEAIDYEVPDGPALIVSGIDMLDGTPIFDVKPYIPVTDCRPEASQSYTEQTRQHRLEVDFPSHLLQAIPESKRAALLGALAQDPRPGYADQPLQEYGLTFAGFDVGFRVEDQKLTVFRLTQL